MSYTLSHIHRKPNRYYGTGDDLAEAMRGKLGEITKKPPVTPETFNICVNSQKAAAERSKITQEELKKSQKAADDCLRGFPGPGDVPKPMYLGPLASAPTSVNTTEVPSFIQSIPSPINPGYNPDASDDVITTRKTGKNNNGLPNGISQTGSGYKRITIGNKTYINGVEQ